MLEIKEIRKEYKTGELVQKALDGVSLVFRDNEFVSILGPSGSGKTTLLNIIGGLDRYDSGDLVINGISTKEYSDQDWDAYRNHSIGFVFQNYNLIPHQSILENVELALTISGESNSVRKQKAKNALEQVGLGDQLHKKPNQMSGGQMQRVAIARALVNDPDILLADEPTGALDSGTSVQIMELLTEVARDRLVVLVTHNSELAEEYSTRIVRLKDGKIVDDSDPCTKDELAADIAASKQKKKQKKSHMSFGTALSLSFNNLKTKKNRTFLTSLAGSIGIIGIALILSLSSGVNDYISQLQADTLTSYPITINATTVTKKDKLSMIAEGLTGQGEETGASENTTTMYADYSSTSSSGATASQNDLTSFKEYLDDPDSDIRQYIGSNGIIYHYGVDFDIYSYDDAGTLVNSAASPGLVGTSSAGAVPVSVSGSSGATNFEELMAGSDGAVINELVTENYDLLLGRYPEAMDEVVVVLDSDNTLPASTLYQLGLITEEEYAAALDAQEDGKDPEEKAIDLTKLMEHTFYMLPACDYYTKNTDGTYARQEVSNLDTALLSDAMELKITGVIRPSASMTGTTNMSNSNVASSTGGTISSAVAYTSLLTDYIVSHTDESMVVQAQKASPDTDVLTGTEFSTDTDEQKAQAAIDYLSELGTSYKASWYKRFMDFAGDYSYEDLNEIERAEALDDWLLNDPDEEILLKVYRYNIQGNTYDSNMESFGLVSFDTPSSISIYVDSFEDKAAIESCIENYNASVDSNTQITYTDYVASMTSSFTSMIDMISMVLICVAAVSLIVSCIMIGIITNISVLERTKEIGVLRALGASKNNISQVFNAETFIIGICSGLIGVIFAALLTIPINAVLASALSVRGLTISLPVVYALLLVATSIVITVIGGLIPARKAAKMDPVLALRSE